MEEPRYIVDCYTEDSMEHGFPENTHSCVSIKQVSEIIASSTREFTGITEIHIRIAYKPPDYDWAKYWRLDTQICRDYDLEFRNEIAKWLPSIDTMSFTGPKDMVDWIFKNVEIK